MAGTKSWLLLVVVLMLLSMALVSSRTMWGVKKKQKEEDLEDKLNDVLLKAGKGKAKKSEPTQRVERKPLSRSQKNAASEPNVDNLFGSANPAEILSFYRLAIQKFKEIVETDQFEQYFNKETFEQVMKTVSEQNLNPEITENLSKLNYDDLPALKEAIRQGITLAEGYLDQVAETINDPSKFAELLEQVPAEFKGVIQALLSGDVSAIKQLLLTLPGVDADQKQMILDLLDGNYQNILNKSKGAMDSILGDGNDDFMEAARQNLLSNLDAAVASGIPLETLQNKKLFADFMKNSMNALLNNDEAFNQLNDMFSAGNNEDEEIEEIPKPKKGRRRVEL